MVDFTGGVSEYIDLVSGNYANDLEKRKELFQKLSKYMDRQSMTSASIKVMMNLPCFINMEDSSANLLFLVYLVYFVSLHYLIKNNLLHPMCGRFNFF